MKSFVMTALFTIGIGAGFMASMPSEAARPIQCDKCSCNLNTGICECTDCIIE